MLNPNVFIELFDLNNKLSDEVIGEFSDIIESNGVRIDRVDNFDTRVYFKFSYPALGALNENNDAQLSGSLIIDRMRAAYEVQMSLIVSESISDSVKYVPLATNDFDEVLRYIVLVNENIDTLMLHLLPKRAYRAVFNEAVAYDASSNYRQLSEQAKQYLVSLLEHYKDGHGADTFDISGVHPTLVNELVNGGYIMVRGTMGALDRTAIDSLRSITFG